MGVALLVVSAVIWLLASTGETVEERDGTALLLTFPLGIYLLVSKTYLLNDREEDNERKDTAYGKETSDRGPKPQELGGRERRAAAGRRGANRPQRYRERHAEADRRGQKGGRGTEQALQGRDRAAGA